MAQNSAFFANMDRVVIARARRGDAGAVETIYRTFADPVFTLGCRLTGSTEGGEEVLQETFLELVRSLGSYRGDAPFGAWLRRVTVSKALMRRRRAKVRRWETGMLAEVVEMVHSGNPVGRWQTKRDLERALLRLPEATRVVVWLHDVEGMTHREIASLFQRSVSFSKSQLSRGHRLLRRYLEGERRDADAPIDGRAAGVSGR